MTNAPPAPARPHVEVNPVIDAYLGQIKLKASCLIAFTPAGDCADLLIREEATIDKLKEIDRLLHRCVAELPVKGGA